MHHHLSHKDRVAIETLLRTSHSQSEIAAQLRVHRSTVSREVTSKKMHDGYLASFAHTRSRVAKIARNLNHRPRKCLNWKTPCQVYGHCCREISQRTRAERFVGLWPRRPVRSGTLEQLATPIPATPVCCVSR